MRHFSVRPEADELCQRGRDAHYNLNSEEPFYNRTDLTMSRLRNAVAAVLVMVLCAVCAACDNGSPKQAVSSIKIHLRYQDTTGPRDIVGSRVEVWRIAPVGGWAKIKEGPTDGNGSYSTDVPYQGGARYALRLFASNKGAMCCTGNSSSILPEPRYNNVFPGNNPTFLEPKDANHADVQLSSSAPGETLNWGTFTIADPYWARAFNIVETMRRAYEYVVPLRETAEAARQTLQPAHVALGGCAHFVVTSCMYPVSGDLFITSPDAFNDSVLIHEYAHWLQYSIGSLGWILSEHNGCVPTMAYTIGGGLPQTREDQLRHLAWMEGFADWFAFILDRKIQVAANLDGTGGVSGAGETDTCAESNVSHPKFTVADKLERHVANMLIDLSDPLPLASGTLPTDDTGDRAKNLDWLIIQIMDTTLGTPTTSAWPTTTDFYWAARSRHFNDITQPESDLVDIYNLNKIPTPYA